MSIGNTEIIKKLLEYIPFLERKPDAMHITPLTLACQQGRSDIAALLLEAGANPDVLDDNGGSPLIFACQEGFEDVVSLLLGYGADPLLARNPKERYILIRE